MGKKDMEAMQAKIEAGEAREANKKAKEMHDKVKKKGVGFLADFKKFITRDDCIYTRGREKYEELAFKYWCLCPQINNL